MSDERYSPAIEALIEEIEAQERDLSASKRMVNSLCKKAGLEPRYAEMDPESSIASLSVRSDQFYRMALATAAQEFLTLMKRRGGGAMPAEEIFKGLIAGGFDFDELGWKENDRLRSLAMSLAKNSKTFERLPNGDFGLVSWYGDGPRRQKDDKSRGANGTKSIPEPITDQEGADDKREATT
jgi:hypothetical protein